MTTRLTDVELEIVRANLQLMLKHSRGFPVVTMSIDIDRALAQAKANIGAGEVAHRQGCDALGGYGHGVGPCSCGAAAPQAAAGGELDPQGRNGELLTTWKPAAAMPEPYLKLLADWERLFGTLAGITDTEGANLIRELRNMAVQFSPRQSEQQQRTRCLALAEDNERLKFDVQSAQTGVEHGPQRVKGE